VKSVQPLEIHDFLRVKDAIADVRLSICQSVDMTE